jgi:hypothetical protein
LFLVSFRTFSETDFRSELAVICVEKMMKRMIDETPTDPKGP